MSEIYNSFRALATATKRTELFIPFSDLIDTRAQNVTTAPAGGFTVEKSVSPLETALRHHPGLFQLGARVVELKGNHALPSITSGGATMTWAPEGGAVTAATATIGASNLTPHSARAAYEFTFQLEADSPGIEETLRADLQSATAFALSLAGLSGLGVQGEPLGILNRSDTLQVTFGGAPTCEKLASFLKLLADEGAEDPGSLAWATSNAARAKLQNTQRFATGGGPLWDDGKIIDLPAYATKCVGNTTSQIVLGNWSKCVFGVWGGGLRIQRNDFSKDLEGIIRLVAHLTADVTFIQPGKNFVISTDSAAQA